MHHIRATDLSRIRDPIAKLYYEKRAREGHVTIVPDDDHPASED